MKHLTILFIGNFEAPHSTENDRAWSMRKLGHNVIEFQENKTTYTDLIDYISKNKVDVVFYSHTHSWHIPNLIEFFETCKKKGIKTVSAHLDLWRGLKRWLDVGKEATWFVDYLFTSDGTDDWPEGVNHYYMRPGIKESSCYLAEPDNIRYGNYDVAFVGSYHYHPEYPERPELIDFLRKEYGERFLFIEHSMRGHDLNVLYRSIPIIVGDSCFTQTDSPIKNYQSDRIPESIGRGAFLIHPEVKHLKNFPGIELFKTLTELKNKIDYWLRPENETKRKERAIIGYEHVKKHHNYTKISEEILEKVFG